MAVYIKKEPFKVILAKSNMTQIALAEKLGIKNPAHLNNVIHGRVSASPDTRNGIMDIFEIKNWNSIFEIREAV
jgi:transcriptional regulator with XRE-family HTH domain